MPRRDLSKDECLEVLTQEHLIRVAFSDDSDLYLIPLGYVYSASALYGVGETGRKITIAKDHPRVCFQVDTSDKTGLFEWKSVMGAGNFEIVSNAEEKQRALGALQPAIMQAPDWWRQEQMLKMGSGSLLVWKITPERLSGCAYEPPESAGK